MALCLLAWLYAHAVVYGMHKLVTSRVAKSARQKGFDKQVGGDSARDPRANADQVPTGSKGHPSGLHCHRFVGSCANRSTVNFSPPIPHSHTLLHPSIPIPLPLPSLPAHPHCFYAMKYSRSFTLAALAAALSLSSTTVAQEEATQGVADDVIWWVLLMLPTL